MVPMSKETKQIPPYLRDKRNELLFALAKQGYNQAQLAIVFNLSTSRVSTIIATMPENYRSPWVKRGEV